MAVKEFKPVTSSRRGMTGYTFEEITRNDPEKSLIVGGRKRAGRNFRGKITVRHHGGGSRQVLRNIDFKREKFGVPGRVISIEYDPNRSARIALIQYRDGEKRYIISPNGLSVGAAVESGPNAEIKPGNALPLKFIPTGTMIHNVELAVGKGAQLVRSAGVGAQLLSKEDLTVLIRLPSGEIRRFSQDCLATIGQVSNIDHKNITLGKAGRRRLMGWRPTVRGSAMSPRDHPHGGGEGRCPVGHPGPRTPWGKPAMGHKTRLRKKSSKMIVKRRK